MLISPAKFIVLDSSILGNLARDYFSSSSLSRLAARGFLEDLFRLGVIPLICWHQFEELIKHENHRVAQDRFAFLRALPNVAWLRSESGQGLGSIVDLLIAECRAALRMPHCDIQRVRDSAHERLFDFGTGAQAMQPYEEIWEALRPTLWAEEKYDREVVAISRADVVDISNKKLSFYLNGTSRKREEALAMFANFTGLLSEEIRNRGDKRITNAEEVALEFYSGVAADSDAFYSGECFDFERSLNFFGVSLADFGPESLMGDVIELSAFRQRLRVVHKIFDVPWGFFVSSISPSQIPSWNISNAVRKYGHKRSEHKGSELNDRHILCLSPYCNLTYVDKQTWEDLKRALKNSKLARSIINQVERNTTYEKIKEFVSKDDF